MDELIEKLTNMIDKGEIDIEGFEYLLTPEEKTIWNVLKLRKHAMNVNEIREAIIDEFVSWLREYDKKEMSIFGESVRLISRPKIWVGKVNTDEKIILEALKEIERKGINLNHPTSREKRAIADILKKKGIVSIPSHKTIERILMDFELAGVVVSRLDISGKGKKLYALNPKLAKFIDSI